MRVSHTNGEDMNTTETERPNTEFTFIQNEMKYWEFIRLLRNNSRVRGGFITQVEIEPAQQAAYMSEHNDDYYICLYDSVPAGYVGVIDDDIRVATHPDFQRMGVGRYMINKIAELYPSAYAKIKVENDSSIRMFEKCGFKKRYVVLFKE